jgi:hypothetical protein
MEQQKIIPADTNGAEKNIREFPGSPASRIGDG